MGGNAITFAGYVQERKQLGAQLPLDMPYTLGIHVTNLCNFKCFYCSASEDPKTRIKHHIPLKHIDLKTYKECIDCIADAGHLKLLFLGGWGEPLLHPDISEMVRYAKQKNMADVVRIYTNASLLTPDLSDRLVDSGLDNIRISLQGLCAEDIEKVCGVKLDYGKFLDNIKYLYEHRKNLSVTIKIMDIMVNQPQLREEFVRQYGEICDEYMVDSLTPKVEDIDYSNRGSGLDKSYLEGKAPQTQICSVPFYRTFIDVDAQLFPCAAIPAPRKFGDITQKGFRAIWEGKEYRQFLVSMLQGKRAEMPICSKCKEYSCYILPTDILDDYADKLIPQYMQEGEK